MMLTGTVLCENEKEEQDLAAQLRTISGVTISESKLSIAIDFSPTDTMSSYEENRSLLLLIDLIENVKVHGLVISP